MLFMFDLRPYEGTRQAHIGLVPTRARAVGQGHGTVSDPDARAVGQGHGTPESAGFLARRGNINVLL